MKLIMIENVITWTCLFYVWLSTNGFESSWSIHFVQAIFITQCIPFVYFFLSLSLKLFSNLAFSPLYPCWLYCNQCQIINDPIHIRYLNGQILMTDFVSDTSLNSAFLCPTYFSFFITHTGRVNQALAVLYTDNFSSLTLLFAFFFIHYRLSLASYSYIFKLISDIWDIKFVTSS